MGKLKKQKKEKHAKPYAVHSAEAQVPRQSDEEMTDSAPAVIPAAAAEPTTLIAEEAIGKIKQRHHEEWKRLRLEIAEITRQKKKLSKRDPEELKRRKATGKQTQKMFADFNKRCAAEIAAARAEAERRATAPAPQQQPQLPAFKFDFGAAAASLSVPQPAVSIEDTLRAVLEEQQRLREQVQRLEADLCAAKQQQQPPPQPQQ